MLLFSLTPINAGSYKVGNQVVIATGESISIGITDDTDVITSISVLSGTLPAGLAIVGLSVQGTPVNPAPNEDVVIQANNGEQILITFTIIERFRVKRKAPYQWEAYNYSSTLPVTVRVTDVWENKLISIFVLESSKKATITLPKDATYIFQFDQEGYIRNFRVDEFTLIDGCTTQTFLEIITCGCNCKPEFQEKLNMISGLRATLMAVLPENYSLELGYGNPLIAADVKDYVDAKQVYDRIYKLCKEFNDKCKC